MASDQPNRCPPDCRSPRCGNLIETRVKAGSGDYQNDSCKIGVPMWPLCPWHTKNKELKK